MNNTKKTIGWCDFSWNPITGCDHGCWYCYANRLFMRFHKSFAPTFYESRLKEPFELKKPSKIFVCSVSDLFASWTPLRWRDAVFEILENCPTKHIFQLLTKNPENIPKNYDFPDNVWVGTTVTNEIDDWVNIEQIKNVNAKIRFVSFEPLLRQLPNKICLEGLQWIIIGKLTGSRKIKLQPNWVYGILDEADKYGIPVFMKNNLGWPEKRQDFPQIEG